MTGIQGILHEETCSFIMMSFSTS